MKVLENPPQLPLFLSLLYRLNTFHSRPTITSTMADNLFKELTAPNGCKFTQPLGMFINNEWRPAKSKEMITVISPMRVPPTRRLVVADSGG